MIDKVAEYYDQNADREWERLNNPYSRVEFETTMHLIDKYFDKSGKIIDIGSGPGRYSLALAKKGFDVSLLDISKEELKIAKDKFETQGLRASEFTCKSALELDSYEENSFDGALVFGPMYHLHDELDRKKVIADLYRILKPGATAIIAYINTFGILRASMYECPDVFENHEEKLAELLSGDMKLSHEEAFTASYFTRSDEAIKEVESSNFKLISYAGAESFVSGLHMETRELEKTNPRLYENYLKMACSCCELPQYRDATEHINIIVRK